MNRNIIWLLILFPLMFAMCQDEEDDDTSNEIVFFNGKIYTVNDANKWADAIYIKDGVIQYVGNNDDAKKLASEDAEMIDLNGDFMMPGIHDVHMHPLEAASDNFKFILDDSVDDPELYIPEIKKANSDNPGNDWLLGWGHLLETIIESPRDPKLILDEISTSRPIAVMEQTSHSLWCNSKALELLGFNKNTPHPPGGIIMKNDNEEPNGLLIDNAGELLMEMALAFSEDRSKNDYNGLIDFALPELAKNGITSISEARTFWKRKQHETWKKIETEGLLTCRVNLGLWAYPAEDDASQIASLKSFYSDNTNQLLRINQIKIYADGIIHNTTSAMFDDYKVDYFKQGKNNGLNYFDQSRLAAYIKALEPTGFDFHIHALGNRGVHESLNAIEQGGSTKGRHRLTHIEYVNTSDIPRFAQLGVIADAQVAGDFTQPANWGMNIYLVGPDLVKNIIPLKSLMNNNARITLSSDWDVSDLNPFPAIQNAVTRAPQNIPIEEAIKAYTINGAYTMRQENKVGSIEVGKEADIIILDQNIMDISPENIGKTKVKATYVKGKEVYRK